MSETLYNVKFNDLDTGFSDKYGGTHVFDSTPMHDPVKKSEPVLWTEKVLSVTHEPLKQKQNLLADLEKESNQLVVDFQQQFLSLKKAPSVNVSYYYLAGGVVLLILLGLYFSR